MRSKVSINPIVEYLVFYLSEFSHLNHLSNDQSFEILNRFEIIDYLADCYETLHTQGKWYVMSDIVEILIEKEYYPPGTKVSDVIKEFKNAFQ